MSKNRQSRDRSATDEIAPPESLVDSFSPSIVLLYLDALLEARRRGALSAEDIDAELRRLTLQDANGDLWAPGARSRRWYRRDGDAWKEAEPPGELFDRPGTSLLRDGSSVGPRLAAASPGSASAPAPAIPSSPSPAPATTTPKAPPVPPAADLVEIPRTAMTGLAAMLRQARQETPPANFGAILKAFVGRDDAGNSWTVNPGTGTFARKSERQWIEVEEAAAPATLWIAPRVIDEVRRLAREAAARAAPAPTAVKTVPTTTGPAATPSREQPRERASTTTPAAATVCPHCNQPAVPGKKFCVHCGKPVAAATDAAPRPATACRHCGKPVAPRSRFCPACGQTL